MILSPLCLPISPRPHGAEVTRANPERKAGLVHLMPHYGQPCLAGRRRAKVR